MGEQEKKLQKRECCEAGPEVQHERDKKRERRKRRSKVRKERSKTRRKIR